MSVWFFNHALDAQEVVSSGVYLDVAREMNAKAGPGQAREIGCVKVGDMDANRDFVDVFDATCLLYRHANFYLSMKYGTVDM